VEIKRKMEVRVVWRRRGGAASGCGRRRTVGGVWPAARGQLCGARVRAEQGAAQREAGAWRRSRALAAEEARAGGGLDAGAAVRVEKKEPGD